MFYLAEFAALAVCWLFYCELYWMVQRKVSKACSREYIRKRTKTLADRLFFTQLSAKSHLGFLYYANVAAFTVLVMLTALHLLTGWIGVMQGFIRVLTTLTVLLLGCVAISGSSASMEYLCTNLECAMRKLGIIKSNIDQSSDSEFSIFYIFILPVPM